ncbi:outer membrane immunogenic protein [Rhodoblastus acidophilus]|uniref:Outer membrane immunogenic protein n=1 Tax=Rhodoblastus acidophilus TaxID=1074 RepID=A0A212RHV1_RHOAC|nr:outer membrane beta-barrel protein [Rhodoblastus acidophilus]MCW2316974.1 outer membrane immunogenic protein [Rhodoblastus acidophilus]PPQ38024.1 porin family protein [Rhodoblastus acidophilus]RAI24330.1 porin family protein [Rhodoblastus acidophilus]SNB71802.1 outer membrane immunogenic protein [Rhodoblastus acidophilus]
MRLLTLASITLASLAGSALAADLPSSKAAPLLAPAPTADWTGFYIGANVGYGGDTFDYPVNVARVGSGSAHLTSGGVLGGGQVGYNKQFGSYLLGLEADIQGTDVKAELGAGGAVGGTTFDGKAGSSLDYFGTVRGRLGYLATSNILVYATGGFAYGGLNSYAKGSIAGVGSASLTKDSDLTGWTVGGGAELALNPQWSVKGEYLYADLGKATLASGNILGTSASLSVKPTVNVFRIGLNYKLDAFDVASVIAKY